mmetsp:Transcript_21655/g.64015  ORF Transcript_21655/g.64015 Transcript_21655/m.64015 type:complete len:285 (+) Transcript_21655:154-1008(+)
MAVKLDEAVGRLVATLQQSGLWDDTLLWVHSDNGGMTNWSDAFPASASVNAPLRGGKTTLFDGGMRVPSFIAGGYLPKATAGAERSALLHAVDIAPTFLGLASAPPRAASVPPLDGIDAWPTIVGAAGAEVPRTELPLQLGRNPMLPIGHGRLIPSFGLNYSAIISWPYKLLLGSTWVNAQNTGAATRDGWWTVSGSGAYVHVPPPPDDAVLVGGVPVRLYDLSADPAEEKNIAAAHPAVVANLTARLEWYAEEKHGYRPPQINLALPEGNPARHNWTWAPYRS